MLDIKRNLVRRLIAFNNNIDVKQNAEFCSERKKVPKIDSKAGLGINYQTFRRKHLKIRTFRQLFVWIRELRVKFVNHVRNNEPIAGLCVVYLFRDPVFCILLFITSY